jgi:hypothetical protein
MSYLIAHVTCLTRYHQQTIVTGGIMREYPSNPEDIRATLLVGYFVDYLIDYQHLRGLIRDLQARLCR